jgi:hypothetical protein
MRKALIRIRAKTLMYHCLVKTGNAKISNLSTYICVLFMHVSDVYVYLLHTKKNGHKRRIHAICSSSISAFVKAFLSKVNSSSIWKMMQCINRLKKQITDCKTLSNLPNFNLNINKCFLLFWRTISMKCDDLRQKGFLWKLTDSRHRWKKGRWKVQASWTCNTVFTSISTRTLKSCVFL